MTKHKTKNHKTKFSIGLDLGGTKLAAALISSHGEVIEWKKVPVTMAADGSAVKTQKRVLGLMGDIAVDFQRRYPSECGSRHFAGVGLASAGPLNVELGTLIFPVNFPGWKVVPIRELMTNELKKRKFKTAVHFQNDAIAAALAEGWIGGAQGMQSYAVITVGTGIGTGVIFQGRPCQTHGMGSEFGHMIFSGPELKGDLSRRKFHTIEGVASGTGLQNRAKARGFDGNSVEDIVHALQNGNTDFQHLFDDMALALATLAYNLSIGFNLEGIFLSGGLLKIKSLYLKQATEAYRRLIRDFNPSFECRMQTAKTDTRAGVIGASYLPYL